MSGLKPSCRTATDEMDAREKCEELCGWIDCYWENTATLNMTSWMHFDCDYFADSNPPPVELAVGDDVYEICFDHGPMDHDPNTMMCTAGVADLYVKLTGANANSSMLGGIMEFSVAPCPITTPVCNITVGKLSSVSNPIQGSYDDGTPSSFEVDKARFKLLQPVMGKLNKSTGEVSFPNDDFYVAVSTGQTVLDATTIHSGFEDVVYVFKDVTGSWDGTQLILNLRWENDDVALDIRLFAE